jgi:hypothetical protein
MKNDRPHLSQHLLTNYIFQKPTKFSHLKQNNVGFE